MFLLIGAVVTAVWVVVLYRDAPRKAPADDGFAVDPALTHAVDELAAEHTRFKGYP
ncbi:hypothetical protein [Microbacterium sp. 1.5R]|uniref:hypothetical protein n=1 Tax=Microbacterium sp. 1.5R TaxID=1916917 RepID=UPI001642E729|nr:hypothetical protein [Microbacterium sp. 1.5R]